jgi:hypothetical protein
LLIFLLGGDEKLGVEGVGVVMVLECGTVSFDSWRSGYHPLHEARCDLDVDTAGGEFGWSWYIGLL